MILVFGSLNMDLVMTVPVLPKPGETVLCPGYTLKPGGKGNNQAVAAARAGAPVAMAGCVGPDAFGSGLVENLVRAGIDTSDVQLVEQPTGCAMICVDADAENFITVASGANLAASSDRIADSRLGPGTTVLMQMEVPPEQNWALIRRAPELGSRTVLNVAPASDVPPDILKLIDHVRNVRTHVDAAIVQAERWALLAGLRMGIFSGIDPMQHTLDAERPVIEPGPNAQLALEAQRTGLDGAKAALQAANEGSQTNRPNQPNRTPQDGDDEE